MERICLKSFLLHGRLREPGSLCAALQAPDRAGGGQESRREPSLLSFHAAGSLSRYRSTVRTGLYCPADVPELLDSHHHRKAIWARFGLRQGTESDCSWSI